MLSVLLDHPRFVIINKPVNIGMHQEGDSVGIVTLARRLLGIHELYPVHRLDKVTSGVLLLAKDPAANSLLSAAFRERKVEKFYVALSDRKPTKKQGLIAGDMAKSRRSSWKLMPTRSRPAVTQFFSGALQQGLRWFLLKPATGKTHQLRVALKSLGAPVLGDPLYAAKSSNEKEFDDTAPAASDAPAPQSDRTYLHAWALCFPFEGEVFRVVAHPETGQFFLQPAFSELLDHIGPPWAQPWPVLPGSLLTAIKTEVGSADGQDAEE